MKEKENWFATWFDSPYYHTLYKNRNFSEAEKFIENLISYLKPKKEDEILDLACGAGRHSIFINKLGYTVTGVDLSLNSISTAKQYSSENLNFAVHDMREVFKKNNFDYIVNLFTSFGYFESEEDNVKMLTSVSDSLKKNGIFVLDFFNAKKVISNLVEQETKAVDGVEFHIKREVNQGYIFKHIEFEVENKEFSFTEKVQAITLSDFESLFSKTDLKIIATFGSYSLEEFNEEESDRLLIVAKK